MIISRVLLSFIADAAPDAAPASNSPIELAVWKWVVIIGVAAILILYSVKRIADVVVKKKTADMIREVVGEGGKGEPEKGDWVDFEEMDKKLDADD